MRHLFRCFCLVIGRYSWILPLWAVLLSIIVGSSSWSPISWEGCRAISGCSAANSNVVFVTITHNISFVLVAVEWTSLIDVFVPSNSHSYGVSSHFNSSTFYLFEYTIIMIMVNWWTWVTGWSIGYYGWVFIVHYFAVPFSPFLIIFINRFN